MRTILVTGASRGIGKAISQRLAAEGNAVIGLARDFSSFGPLPEGMSAEALDLADLGVLPGALKRLQRAHAGVDAIICNAGRGEFGSLEEFSYQQISALMNLNFVSHAYLLKAFLPAMKKNKRQRGDVVFIGSEAALAGARKGAVYCASKAALRGFAQALREECARSHIHVSIINPGMVRSDFFRGLSFAPGDAPENAILPEEVAETVAQVLAMRAGVVVDEINLSPLKKVIRF